MNLVFLCILPFRSRIVLLEKEGCFNKSECSSKSHTFSEKMLWEWERTRTFQLERGTEKKTYFTHTFICVYVQICMFWACSHIYMYTSTHTSLPSYPEDKGLHCLSLHSFPFKHKKPSAQWAVSMHLSPWKQGTNRF